MELKHSTIQKTLITARFIDGFWDRWIAHGVDPNDLRNIRPALFSERQWINGWQQLAHEKKQQADVLKQQEVLDQAERLYRTAGLYYNLMQWIYPEREAEKEKWFRECFRMTNLADTVSPYQTTYAYLPVGENFYEGRLTIPKDPKGCVIIINPLDSSKEELFTYEQDFVQSGFITLSFDGPGQGETWVHYGLKGSRQRWALFLEQVIDYAAQQFSSLPIFLFGTSSGASWAIYGSGHPKVSKTVAVSPALRTDHVQLPEYFLERMGAVLEEEDFLPAMDRLPPASDVFLFHGKKDVLVPNESMYNFKEQLRISHFMEYEEEGHCCNFKLNEVRRRSVEWFLGK